jgi:hypothetical protein
MHGLKHFKILSFLRLATLPLTLTFKLKMLSIITFPHVTWPKQKDILLTLCFLKESLLFSQNRSTFSFDNQGLDCGLLEFRLIIFNNTETQIESWKKEGVGHLGDI